MAKNKGWNIAAPAFKNSFRPRPLAAITASRTKGPSNHSLHPINPQQMTQENGAFSEKWRLQKVHPNFVHIPSIFPPSPIRVRLLNSQSPKNIFLPKFSCYHLPVSPLRITNRFPLARLPQISRFSPHRAFAIKTPTNPASPAFPRNGHTPTLENQNYFST
jgi:hypothetical protein